MPQRSTPFQAIVYLVRQHFAQPGVTVTESKMFRDSVLGNKREVDVVVEGDFDGEPMVVSFEVKEPGRRPADLTWVEQMLRKHQNLPTNCLVLVSKSGFTRNALAAVSSQAGRVQALQPEIVHRDGQPVVTRLFADAIRYTPTGCKLIVNRGGDERSVIVGEPLLDVCDDGGNVLGSLAGLVYEAVGLEAIRKGLCTQAHHHPEKDQVTGFTVGLALPQLGYYLRWAENAALHLIEALEVQGDFSIAQAEIPLTLTNLGGRLYGAAEAVVAGHPTVWVGTTDVEAQTTTLSWRTTDRQALIQAPTDVPPMQFPGLLTLSLPDSVTSPSPAVRD